MITENEIRQKIEQVIPDTDSSISIHEISKQGTHYIVTLYGGLNGRGDFFDYLSDVQHIVLQLDNVWLIDWINDCLDDVWTLRIGVR
jgi:hypothetical protein